MKKIFMAMLSLLAGMYVNGQRPDSAHTHHFDSTDLPSIRVNGQRKTGIATNPNTTLDKQQLFQTAGQTLGESLKNIPGLNSIQTGPSISKPVIHGLHSNRVLIINNGVRQEGQQWGAEHAPEIDPFVASSVTVIKGAASVRYGSDAIVGVVMVDPKPLAPEKLLSGEATLVAGYNGRSGAASALFEGAGEGIFSQVNWRAQGSLKRAGNFSTAHYFMKNTGVSEADFSLTANYANASGRFGGSVYYSRYSSRIGIFEGSHVGNVADLDSAFERARPLTADIFSYSIARSYQQITHKLLKADAHYHLSNGGRLEAVFSDQRNLRNEYDIDLPYSSDPNILKMPQISFLIKTQTLELIYRQPVHNHLSGEWGLSGMTQGNVFKGIRYLVPNFRNYNGGAYVIQRYAKDYWMLEAGLRYDYRWLRVYRINNNSLQTYSNTHDYRNVTGTVGGSYRIGEYLSFTGNIGTAWRAPSVNELYIDGIHLSAASYEKGDSSLRSERSYNFTASVKYEKGPFYAELVAYDNIINGYIYAKPSLAPVTLISGTYPLFNYTQTNVDLKGLDAELRYKFFGKLTIDSKASIVRGWNKSIHDWLIFMPADRFDNSLRCDINKKWFVSSGITAVTKQTRVPPNSDYVPPPNAYTLLNARVGYEGRLFKQPLNLELAGTNLTNRAYRDYLNRFRYYADDLGIDIVLRARISF